MNKWLVSSLIAGLIFSTTAIADGVASLKDFYHSTNSMRAKFHQVVKDNTNKVVQEVDGTMQLQRPNKFRWDYKKPYEQEIISDGKDVFLYDKDLEQVTIRALTQTLGSSPASLLAGGDEVEKSFDLKNINREDGLDWVQALPKNDDSGFERIMLAFKDQRLMKMEMHDSFKNITLIDFSAVERNPSLSLSSFLFTTPDGVDVVKQ
jgi:outer membrane lipoprotein carrier protein